MRLRHRRMVVLSGLVLLWPAAVAAQTSSEAATAEAGGGDAEPAWLAGRLVFDWEAGPLVILRNDGRYGEDGTEYTAGDTAQTDNLVLTQRFALELELVPRHRLILLYAPLEVVTRVRLDDDLRFRDTTFVAGSAVEHRYLFDGYRLSYLFGALRRAVDLDVGASFQVRNANVAFTALDGSGHEAESDIGLVFAIKLRLLWESPSGPWMLVDADGFSTFGLAGDTTGAIYDAALSLGFPVADGLDVFVRARALGGGADVPRRDLENWAHFLSFAVGLRVDLPALF